MRVCKHGCEFEKGFELKNSTSGLLYLPISSSVKVIKAIENFFCVFAYPDINTRGAGRILDSYANPRRSLDSYANPRRSLDSYANPRLRLGFA